MIKAIEKISLLKLDKRGYLRKNLEGWDMKSLKDTFMTCFLLFLSLSSLLAHDECTTAVVAGTATIDGRPLLWKNRDTDAVDNEVVYFSGGTYDVVGVVTADSSLSVWTGINSAGFAIENSLSNDLEGASTDENGTFMKYALQYCATVDEFEQLLIDTNNSGRGTKANYGVIDATGAAAIFETGNHTYTKFDANETTLGFIVRTNFAETGDGSGKGYERYDRAVELFTEGVLNSEMSHEYILREISRDLKNDQIDPYPLPYEGSQDGHAHGYIRTYYSINRYRTRSCAVFHGVLPDEDPRLSTMWVILGEPACGVAVPIWVYAGTTPSEMDGLHTAPMCDLSISKEELCYTDPALSSYSYQYIDTYALDDGAGNGIFSYSFPIENWTFTETNFALNDWRSALPNAKLVKNFESDIISQVYCCHLTSTIPTDIHPPLQFSGETVLNRSLSQAEYINVLTLQANPGNENIEKYRIYQVERENKILLDELNAGTFIYWHRNVENDKQYVYAVYAVNNENREGNPACTTIGENETTTETQETTAAVTETGHAMIGWTGSFLVRDTLLKTDLDSDKSANSNSKKIHKPLNLTIQKVLDLSLSQTDFINLLTWQSNPDNENIVKYRIYQIDENIRSLLVELNATTFEYLPPLVEKDKRYIYALVAVDDKGRESDPAYITIY